MRGPWLKLILGAPAALVAVALLVNFASAGGDDDESAAVAAPSDAASATPLVVAAEPTATPTVPPLPTPAPMGDRVTGEPLLHMARQLAEQWGVSLEESLRRLDVEYNLGPSIEPLTIAAGDRFAGDWIEHEPIYQFVLALKGFAPPSAEIQALVAAAAGPVDVRLGRKYTVAELQAVSAKAVAYLMAEKISFSMAGVDQVKNVVMVEISAFSDYADRSTDLEVMLERVAGPEIEVRVPPNPYPPPRQPDDWLPRTNYDGAGGWDLMSSAPGYLVRDGNCLYLEIDGTRWLPIFHRPREIASFDDTTNELILYGNIFPVGTRMRIGGYAERADGPSPLEELRIPAHPSCDTTHKWFVWGSGEVYAGGDWRWP